MDLRNKIQVELKDAQKTGDTLSVSVLRMLNAAIINKEKEKRGNLSKEDLNEEELTQKSRLNDEEIMEVVASEVKKRKDAIVGFKKGGRKERAEQERKELEILMEYMPEQMPEEEVRRLAQESIKEIGASAPQDMGKVMGVLMPRVKGKAEGSLVGKIVREELSK